ncbi:MAG: hypothetical protein LBM98_02670 [Oscillospiraceae bacterium]|jgi:hypothetical protein|nr:hypothetical protein [Oscillospiraceae bacterium]
MERRRRQTQFTQREIMDVVNDPRYTPYDGGLHYPKPISDKLEKLGKLTFALYGDNKLEYEFTGLNSLKHKKGGVWLTEYYESYEAAPDVIFFFHLVRPSWPQEMKAFCVDLTTNRVTINNAQIGNDEYSPRDTSSNITFATIEGRGAVTGEAHEFTDDFTGKVAAWKIGDIWLTHHYINHRFFLNEILGVAPDSIFLTIAEPAQYVCIDRARQLYVFSWREMAGPGILGMDVMDFSTMTSAGMFFGINETDRFECYAMSRRAGKWLSVEDRKKLHKEGIYSVVGNL